MLAVTDQRIPREARLRLTALGFEVVTLPPFSRLSPPVASHPDMLMLPLGDRLFVTRAYYGEAKRELDAIAAQSGRRLCPIAREVSPKYPDDVGLNLCVVGKTILGRVDKAPKEVLAYAETLGYTAVSVRQGYAKCSTVVMGSRGLITADRGIEAAARRGGVPCLLISPGHVSLPGYDCGFLGGASGVCGGTVYFCGDLMTHPDGEAITDFCQYLGFTVVSLGAGALFDVGTIFFL